MVSNIRINTRRINATEDKDIVIANTPQNLIWNTDYIDPYSTFDKSIELNTPFNSNGFFFNFSIQDCNFIFIFSFFEKWRLSNYI